MKLYMLLFIRNSSTKFLFRELGWTNSIVIDEKEQI